MEALRPGGRPHRRTASQAAAAAAIVAAVLSLFAVPFASANAALSPSAAFVSAAAARAGANPLRLRRSSVGAAGSAVLGTARAEGVASAVPAMSGTAACGSAALLAGAFAGLQQKSRAAPAASSLVVRHAQGPSDVNYFALLFKGDLPKRIALVLILLALARVGFYIPLYGFDADATAEYFSRQAGSGNLGFIDQLFGGGLGRVSLFALGIGPYITSSIVFQILTTVTPALKSLAQGEEGEAGRDRYKDLIKQVSFGFALVQGFGQSTSLSPYVFDNGPLWSAEITIQFALGAMLILFISEKITEQKLGNGASLLVFSSIVANLPRTIASTVSKATEMENGTMASGIFAATLLITILGLVYILQAERRIPILFAKRLQDEASGRGGTDDAGQSYLPIKLNASGVLPLIFCGSLLSLPALAANYTKAAWLQPVAKSLLPGSSLYIPISMVLIGVFSYVSTFQVLDPKDMATNLRKQAAAIPQVRPGKETQDYLTEVLSRSSIFGAVILALLFVLPNLIELLTQLNTPNGFGGTSLLILVGVGIDTWRQLQAELLMQQYATDVDQFYKGRK
ncbi:unnamed protein product [Polarella glacialis]|uniref:CpSecY n=2 Tax=Polarella glacialis TaxID=89957 RepID=A0A813G4R5_POLGL|nr:unnamed protein product [Polarella glacialis]CAE8720129.1 unnamed protein product [Polarella glacialis]